MLEYFTPQDNELEDNNHHKKVRDKTTRPPNTPDDFKIIIEKIRRVIEGMDNKKATGEDGIAAEIYKQTFKILLKTITAMYNGCLKTEFSRRYGKRQKSYRLRNQTTK
jgi:hypothetical protein